VLEYPEEECTIEAATISAHSSEERECGLNVLDFLEEAFVILILALEQFEIKLLSDDFLVLLLNFFLDQIQLLQMHFVLLMSEMSLFVVIIRLLLIIHYKDLKWRNYKYIL
jgi:hypothetical protein